jgi:predicted transcriptional regulator of viral defense system
MSGVRRKTSAELTKFDIPLDSRIARISDAQHRVISLAQLVEEGLSAGAVRMRVAAGRLHRVHQGVFAVGGAGLTAEGRRMAAVLACGEGAALSHLPAADQLRLVRSAGGKIHVTVPVLCGRRRPGLVIHRSATLGKPDRIEVNGIPCTSVARTLLDLADVLGPERLTRAIDEAERLRLFDLRAIDDQLARNPGRPAASKLGAALHDYREPPPTREELERAALALFLRAGLSAPRCNALVPTAERPLEVDFLWPDRRLIVEADSYAWHSGRRAFEWDRRRDQLLRAEGWTVVRITWRQIARDPQGVIAALAS